MTRKSVRKSGLDSGHNPPTIVLSKEGKLCTGNGSPFRDLGAYPLDLISYEAGSFDVVKSEADLRAAITRIGRMLGKTFDAETAIADAMRPAPVRARNQYSELWASQALDVGFLTY
ncbi:MAG: hypothetical protein OXQ92_14760 [Boseongicola sp.]|nr:hypothetical protein [Boseongicola sp.]MDD9977876.1 hypothetical protein [Boseongicola sp.]